MKLVRPLSYIMMVLAILIPMFYETVVKFEYIQPGTITLLLLHSWNVAITTIISVFSCIENKKQSRSDRVHILVLLIVYFAFLIVAWDETLLRNVICCAISLFVVIKLVFFDNI